MTARDPFSEAYWNFCARQRQTGKKVEITRIEFRDWWIESGKWAERGVNSEKYCMSLIDKKGTYNLDNIRCVKINSRYKEQ